MKELHPNPATASRVPEELVECSALTSKDSQVSESAPETHHIAPASPRKLSANSVSLPSDKKLALRRHSNTDIGSTSTSTKQHSKPKETFKEFLARTKKNQTMSSRVKNYDVISDDYAKAASCGNLIRKPTGIIFDDRMLLHECPWDPNYPEKPDRYRAVMDRCTELGLIDRCVRLPHRQAFSEEIIAMHESRLYTELEFISNISNLKEQERHASGFDAIYFNNATFEAAELSAGCAISLVHAICKEQVQNGMAIIRPPGHHAMKDAYCGYCYFNNVALAAKYALNHKLAQRILIVDFDVHHGQGTQRMFYEDNRVLYFSIHRYEHGKYWPNLRESNFDNIGNRVGAGYNINVPLNKIGMGDSEYMSILTHILLPVAYEFQPDLIIISAGFDGTVGDEKGEMVVSPGFYGHLVMLLSGLAQGRIAVCLEGGYFLPSLAEGAAMTLKALLGDPAAVLSSIGLPDPSVVDTINNLKIVLHNYWNCFRVFELHYGAELNVQLHEAVVKYEGTPDKPPFATRNCYPVRTSEEKEHYINLVEHFKNEYAQLGTNQTVGYCYDETMLLHTNVVAEPAMENPKRLQETFLQFQQWDLEKRCTKLESKDADIAVISRVHDSKYMDHILKEQFDLVMDPNGDMYYNKNTLAAVLKSAGCLLAVTQSVMEGRCQSGAAFIRPPGHHADKAKASGFCYVNNVAVTAQYILDKYPVNKILIVDFDIHHGNGTQNIFYENNKVLYISVHRYDGAKYFPYSTAGGIDFCGKNLGEGYNVNVAMSKNKLANVDYISIFHRIVLPIAYSYAPEVVLVSAGFDAGINDNLGNYMVTPDCFGHFIQMLKPLANGKMILALEGGYNVLTVKYSMNICIKTLLGDPLPKLDFTPNIMKDSSARTLDLVINRQKVFWPVLNVDRPLQVLNSELPLEIGNQDELSGQVQQLDI